MRVAIITPEFVTGERFDGGLANYCYRLGQALIEIGHHPAVIVPGKESIQFQHDGISVIQVKVDADPEVLKYFRKKKWRFGGRKVGPVNEALYCRSLALNNVLASEHRRIPFGVAHYAHLGGLALHRLENLASVVRISSSTRLCHEMGGYGQNDEEMLQQVSIETEAMKAVDAIFGPSKMVAALTSEELDKPVTVIETPFTLELAHYDEKYTDHELENKDYMLFFGSIGRLKGVETIARILEDFLRAYPEMHFVFVGKVLAGPGDSTMIEHVLEKAGSTKDRVIHYDKMEQKFLYPIIRDAKAVVLPSLIDNFPNSCIESMAHQRIVVGTEKNGFEQLIRNGENGYLIEADNAEQLLNRLNTIMRLNGEERKQLGAKALLRIEELHPSIVVKELIGFYKETIQNKGN